MPVRELLAVATLLLLLNSTQVLGSSPSKVFVIHDGVRESHRTISEAIQAARPNDTVLIGSGVFHEHLVIDKPLLLMGDGGAVIDGDGVGTTVTVNNTGHVAIQSLRLTGSGRSYSTEDSGIKIVNSTDFRVSGAQLDDVFFGIIIESSSNIRISGNVIEGIGGDVGQREHAIYIWYSSDVAINNNRITYVADAAYCDHAYGITVAGNTISDGRYGVHLMYCADVIVRGNHVSGTIAGSVPMYSQRVEIVGNEFSSIRGAGIGEGIFALEDDYLRIADNTIAGNIVGLSLERVPYQPNATVLVSGNTVAFNYLGIRLDTISRPLVSGNSFIENVQDVSLLGAGNSSASWSDQKAGVGNFWSSRPHEGPVVIRDGLEGMLDDYRQVRIFTFSPAYMMLETMKTSYSAGSSAKLVDGHPLVAPERLGLTQGADGVAAGLIYPAVLTGLAVGLIFLARRRRG